MSKSVDMFVEMLLSASTPVQREWARCFLETPSSSFEVQVCDRYLAIMKVRVMESRDDGFANLMSSSS